MKLLYRWLLLCLLPGLSGCAFQELPPVTEYSLEPSLESVRQDRNPLPLTIRLAPISASQMYLTPDLYYVDASSYQHNPYAYSRWVDAPVRMLQLVLQDGLEQSGLFKAVLPSSSMLRPDLRLETTLYDFSQQLGADDSSAAVVRLRFYLIDARKGKILGSKQFISRVPAPSRDARGGVAAINEAVALILPRLVSWLADAAQGN
ncbi:MAG TPA: hypothetical protein ENH48_07875 [Halieaceae bacterium]|nr:hypothetical protein [Halieaceae bacterium]